jgi:hypothetical protein
MSPLWMLRELLHSHRCLAVHDYCHPSTLLNVSAYRVFGHLVLWLGLCPTLLLHLSICTGPFFPHGFPISTWDFEPLPRCPSCWYSALRQHSPLCCFIQLAVLSATLSVDKSGTSSFPFLWATMFERRILEPGLCWIPERLFCLQFLVFVGQYKTKSLELVPNHCNPFFLIS